jgi:hypothetical protein
MNKSRRMKWVRHMAYREKTNAYRVLVGKPKGKRNLEDLRIVGRILLKLNLEKYK